MAFPPPLIRQKGKACPNTGAAITNPNPQRLTGSTRDAAHTGKAELAIPRSINYYTAKSFADYVMDSPDLGNDRKVDEEKLKAFLQEKFC